MGTRLDCWKEIAAYLGKVERTVKRWDADRSLPIHRVPGGGRASVYAYTAELNEWLKSTRAQEPETAVQACAENAVPESSGTAFGAPDASVMVHSRIPKASSPRLILRQNWLLAFSGLLLAGAAGTAVFSVVVRTASQNVQAKSEPAASIASGAEKSQAHDLYMKGRYEWNQRTADSLNRALAFSEWWGNWDFRDGEREFRRTIALNPRDPVARKWYANVLAVQGQFSDGLEENERAQELDPTSNSILADRGLMLFNSGKRDEGIALLKEVERSAPEYLSPHNYLMILSLELKDYPSYLEEGKKTAEIENDAALKDVIASARAGYERDGERGLLNNLYAKQKEYYQAGKLWGTDLAKTCILMGKKQEALQLLEEAYSRHESDVISCLSQPDLLTLRDEPEYKALVRKMNFPLERQVAQQDTLPAESQSTLRASSDPH